jgi:hypothetical protein
MVGRKEKYKRRKELRKQKEVVFNNKVQKGNVPKKRKYKMRKY